MFPFLIHHLGSISLVAMESRISFSTNNTATLCQDTMPKMPSGQFTIGFGGEQKSGPKKFL